MRTRSVSVVLAAVVLSGCSHSTAREAGSVPTPVATIPVAVAELSQTIGEYVVAPSPTLSKDDVAASIKRLAGMPGVQSAKLVDGQIRVEILPDALTTQRETVERQLAALGTVSEGI